MADTYAGSLGAALLRANGWRETLTGDGPRFRRDVLSGRTLASYTVTVTITGSTDAALGVSTSDGRSLGTRLGTEAEITDAALDMVVGLSR